jgi:hypothetical protein
MLKTNLRTAAALVAFFLVCSPGAARASTWLIPPVDGLVSRPFERPQTDYGPGHRGIDFAVPVETAVRAAGSGVVTFAGGVAGLLAVSIDHGGGLATTYTRLSSVTVSVGDQVAQGAWIGRSGESHPGEPGLHFGVRQDGAYVDPASYFGPLDAGSAVHLIPVEDFGSSGPATRACTPQHPLEGVPPAPNRNIAVAIAGIGSKTEGGVSADMYEQGPEFLGYPAKRVYDYSYKGVLGPHLHEPYETTDTFGDLRAAALKLRDLLTEIARRHPGVPVDLIAHSQGGIVARAFLELEAGSWDPGLPRIAHLVTFASPHQGAPIAGTAAGLRQTTTGRLLLGAASRYAKSGGRLPDPDSVAAEELAPGSALMNDLATRDVLWGTQVLALGIASDVVVPADRAMWPGKTSRVVAPGSQLWGHRAILSSPVARGLAHDFLRDKPAPCGGSWDAWGTRAGRAIGAAESSVPFLYRVGEGATGLTDLGNAARAVGALGRGVWDLGAGLAGAW